MPAYQISELSAQAAISTNQFFSAELVVFILLLGFSIMRDDVWSVDALLWERLCFEVSY